MESSTLRIRASSIMDRARTLTRDGRHMDAIAMLSDSLIGITADQCISIISGRNKLVDGKNGIDMVPDEDPTHREDMESHFGGRLRMDEGWFQPYAVVTDIGPMDEDFELPHCRARTWAISSAQTAPGYFLRYRGKDLDRHAARPLHYAEDNSADRLVYVAATAFLGQDIQGLTRMPLCVLLREVDAPPPWIKPAANLAKAVRQVAAEPGGLRITGHHEEYGSRQEPEIGAERIRMPSDDELREVRENDAAREEAFRRRCGEIAEEVRRRAGPEDGEGWVNLYAGERIIRVPYGPFEGWALSRAGAAGMSDWSPVSESGLKLVNDNPWHSDWMLAAGLPLDAMYSSFGRERDGELVDAAHDLAARIQRERLHFTHEVLSGEGSASGRAWIARRDRSDLPPPGAVVVLPNASPDWLEVVATASAVITERGGAMAHLVSVLRPGGIPVVRMQGARKAIEEGTFLTVDCHDGSIVLGDGRISDPVILGPLP